MSAYDASRGGAKSILKYVEEKKRQRQTERRRPKSPYQPATIPSYVRII